MIGMRPSFRYAGDDLSENALCNAGRDALFLIPGAQSPAVKLAAFARRFAPLAKRSGKRCPPRQNASLPGAGQRGRGLRGPLCRALTPETRNLAMTKTYVRALTIAGSDSCGGAGIQADLKTFAALGCYGMSAITAVTAQNTLGVQAIAAVPPDVVRAQIEAVLADPGVDVIKIGMLFSSSLIRTVAQCLQKCVGGTPLVLDPVMVAQSGDSLLENDAVTALREALIPLATLMTPNLPEAEKLGVLRARRSCSSPTTLRKRFYSRHGSSSWEPLRDGFSRKSLWICPGRGFSPRGRMSVFSPSAPISPEPSGTSISAR